MVLTKLPDFTNQLTIWLPSKKELKFATKQLKRHGDQEGVDFIIKEQNGEFAVFKNTEVEEIKEKSREKGVSNGI